MWFQMRKAIICFTGFDGSGKTSHAFKLIEEMKKIGIPCKYTWCRWAFGFSSVFHFLVRKTLGYTQETYKYLKPLQIIFQYLIFLDFTLSIFVKVRIPSILGRCVIIDRYIYDAWVDLAFRGFDISTRKYFVRLMLKMNPEPDITFLINVPPHIALSRKNDLRLIDAIRLQKSYNDMARIHDFQIITNIDFREAHNQISKFVFEKVLEKC